MAGVMWFAAGVAFTVFAVAFRRLWFAPRPRPVPRVRFVDDLARLRAARRRRLDAEDEERETWGW
jgi:hypothetical protein